MAEELQISDFDYHLPPELIAQEPSVRREDARLLVVNRATQTVTHHHVYDLPRLLNAGDLLIFNNTKVLPARLFGIRSKTGGKWEGLFLRERPDLVDSPWELMSQTRGYLQPNEWIDLLDRDENLSKYRLQVVGRTPERQLLINVKPDISPVELLEGIGHVPLPHYIRDGVDTPTDRQRYQTVFAEQPGSVAAPTAGLHFTPELLVLLQQQGIRQTQVTLHVGAGTFAPIKVENLADHRMHEEWCQVSQETVEAIQQAKGRRIAVGTTSVRTLESAILHQVAQRLRPWSGNTSLFIRPGFPFRSIDGLLTNFHLPRSTLLVLISALAGRELILRAYQEAIQERYRFFSYGDAMLIL
ncbi:MAG TPA: tRNA preQ1(34) S-adenosylmethionine ribosyltransferase-isomerase QueA [Gemmatales bacterium]|nr:tRNA preQ1(34) S-adenosylmethionine ribosyltransferase-isomerase QueA [Gemmatales bacterium]